mmetsp:Transcript_9631/g.21147  ORF Transcript_9631/g.21147 Transcript_9631/m.21147 type:complete len:158 (+) Transcript_9631:263-736(+)
MSITGVAHFEGETIPYYVRPEAPPLPLKWQVGGRQDEGVCLPPPGLAPVDFEYGDEQEDDDNQGDSQPRRVARQQKNRHCKNKRDRYRRLVHRLVQLALTDSDAFHYEMEHNLPPSIADCPVSRAKLEATIAKVTQDTATSEGSTTSEVDLMCVYHF